MINELKAKGVDLSAYHELQKSGKAECAATLSVSKKNCSILAVVFGSSTASPQQSKLLLAVDLLAPVVQLIQELSRRFFRPSNSSSCLSTSPSPLSS